MAKDKSLLVRGMNVLAATISTSLTAPVIAATRLRQEKLFPVWRYHAVPTGSAGLGQMTCS